LGQVDGSRMKKVAYPTTTPGLVKGGRKVSLAHQRRILATERHATGCGGMTKRARTPRRSGQVREFIAEGAGGFHGLIERRPFLRR